MGICFILRIQSRLKKNSFYNKKNLSFTLERLCSNNLETKI
jgi:hypothetical protein